MSITNAQRVEKDGLDVSETIINVAIHGQPASTSHRPPLTVIETDSEKVFLAKGTNDDVEITVSGWAGRQRAG